MATIAEERAANARARAEGYESAAHKEAHANVGASAAGYANAVQQEIDANRRAQAAGVANAAEKEMDANRRSIDAGFTSAVDQEIDANRRAREAGYLNAADYESGLRTRSDAPFLDPRLQPAPVIPEKFRLGTANLLKYNPDQPNVPGYDPNWRNDPKYAGGFDVHGNPITGGGGPPNPTVPSFGYPQYQDWTRFMPTNFQLAEGGGMHYQPGAWGNLPGAGGTAIGVGNNIWNTGTATGGTTATGGPGPINPNIWGTPNANVNTTGVRPGSDKANDLAAGRTHHPQMYDANDMWVGAEGGGEVEAMNLDKFDAPQSAAGAAFMDKLGKTVGALTNPGGFVSAFNNAYNNSQPISNQEWVSKMSPTQTGANTTTQTLANTTPTAVVSPTTSASTTTGFAYPSGYQPRTSAQNIDYASAMRPGMPGYEPEDIYDFEDRIPMQSLGLPSQYQQGLAWGDLNQLGRGLLGPWAIEQTIPHPSLVYTPTDYVQQQWANTPSEATAAARMREVEAAADRASVSIDPEQAAGAF